MSNSLAGCPHAHRRLRPIYELLDTSNNKKALHEAEKVLKKQPNSTCAKALKCLALLRLGREDESLELLQGIKNEVPVDESTLQALTVCYREIHQPQAICEVYEKASIKEPGNEDILSNLFFAYVRIGDYAKQRLSAMSLYKINPTNQYHFWVFISTLLQSVDNVDDLIRLCSIPSVRDRNHIDFKPSDKGKSGITLVHRLIEKCIHENKIKSEQEVLTYLLVLEMLGKHEEALSTLDSPLSAKLEPSNLMNKKVDLLVRLERWEEVRSQLEDMIFEEPDSWHCYLTYFDSVVQLAKDLPFDASDVENPFVKAKTFLDNLVMSQKDFRFKKRGPFLARLELYSILAGKELPAHELYQLLPLLEEYFVEFGDKESCVHDLKRYLHLNVNGVVSFLASSYKTIGLKESRLPTNKSQLNRLVSNAELGRLIGFKDFLGVYDKVNLIQSLVNQYIGCLPLCKDASPTETKTCDRLAIIGAHSLFELWTDTEDSNYLFEAAVLCEYALSHTNCNSQLRILLLKFYHLLGSSYRAHEAYVGLDLKHMQLDTMGYLHVFPLLASGSYTNATNVLNSSIKFFTNNTKESADLITFAYKCEALTKIPEFIGIREKMFYSTHSHLTTSEKMLYEMFSATNFSHAVQMAKEMEISLNLNRIKWNELRDNRDFNVLWDIESPDRRLTEECIVQSYSHDLLLLRLRNLLLHCIVSSLNIGRSDYPSGKNESDVNDLTYPRAHSTLLEYITQLQNALKPVANNIPSPLAKRFIAGPPVSRLLLMLQVNYFNLITTGLNFLRNFTPVDDSSRDKCEYQLDSIVLFVDEYMRYVKSIANNQQLQLRNALVQVCALFVELVSFCCILIGVCDQIISKSRQKLVKKKNKKKEIDIRIMDSPDEFEWRSNLTNKFISFLVGVIKNMESILHTEEKLWNDKNSSNICELTIIKNVKNEEEREAISTLSERALEDLKLCYTSNLSQMSSALKAKSKYLNSLKV